MEVKSAQVDSYFVEIKIQNILSGNELLGRGLGVPSVFP